MGEIHVYFKSDDPRDQGFCQVLLNPNHKGYSAFLPAGGIAIAYNDMKVLEAHELLSAITKGTSYISGFAFGYKIDKTVSAVLESTKTNNWVNL